MVIADGFGDLCEKGRLIIKPQIDYLTENAVIFDDGSILEDVDIILYANGYLPDYDFVDIPGIRGK